MYLEVNLGRSQFPVILAGSVLKLEPGTLANKLPTALPTMSGPQFESHPSGENCQGTILLNPVGGATWSLKSASTGGSAASLL